MYFFKIHLIFTVTFLFNITFSQSWVQQASGTVLNLQSVFFINSNSGFIGCDSGRILRTTNAGNNWTIYNTFTGRMISAIQFIDNNTGFASIDNKVLKTTNSGLTWDTTISGGGKSISFISSNTGYSLRQIYMPVIWKTTNQGSSWDSIAIVPVPIGAVNKIAFKNSSEGYVCGNIFTMSFNIYNAFIMKTTNGGINWGGGYYSPAMLSGATVFDVSLVSDSVFAAGNESSNYYLYRSYNNGTNWLLFSLPYRMISLKFINSKTGWLCGDNGKILYTENSGNIIYEQVSGTSAKLNQIYMINNLTGFISGNNGVILKTTNGGITGLSQLNSDIPNKYSLAQNYPNPFNPATQISFEIPMTSFVNLSLYDAIGREIAHLVNQQLAPGSYKVDWDASNYPSGVYYYRIEVFDPSTTLRETDTKKMVLIK